MWVVDAPDDGLARGHEFARTRVVGSVRCVARQQPVGLSKLPPQSHAFCSVAYKKRLRVPPSRRCRPSNDYRRSSAVRSLVSSVKRRLQRRNENIYICDIGNNERTNESRRLSVNNSINR
jgi:hypothetical protein